MAPGFRSHSHISLHYLTYDRPGTTQTYKLPLAHARLTHKKNTFYTTALIDSGSTTNFLPIEFADMLELDMSGKRANPIGAGGEFESVVSRLDKCELFKRKNTVFDEFVNMHIEVPTKPGTLPYMVLGRDSIFRHFNIRFEENNEKVMLRRAG